MIRRPPRSTQGVSSAASDVYKRQDASHNKGTKKLTVVVKDQADQFDNQTLTGITKTVEVNDDSVSLKPEDFVSQDTKDLLGKATKGVKWTFVCLLYTSPSPRDS